MGEGEDEGRKERNEKNGLKRERIVLKRKNLCATT